jgi:hypothetical protein
MDEKLEAVKKARVASSTLRQYTSCYYRIIEWFCEFYPEIVDNEGELILNQMSIRMFQEFLIYEAEDVGISRLKLYRSSLFHLYIEREQLVPEELKKQLTAFYQGLGRIQASQKVKGTRKLKEGKSPLPFKLYQWIAAKLFESGETFAHLYLIISWNLMCRTVNTEQILLEHLEWDHDSLVVLFAKTKTDQESENPKDGKHVYANPLIPEICPILSLGMYFLSNPKLVTEGSCLLFSGSNQSKRFSRIIHDLLRTEEGKSACRQYGIPASDIGTHSIRKGSSTFTCSGSTAGPSISAICIRAGWSLGGVLDRYIRYEAAADYYVGRVVSGLPLSDCRFATMPPYFRSIDVDDMQNIRNCMPAIDNHKSLSGVIIHSLASVVYHEEFLRNRLQKGHSIFDTFLFRNDKILAELKRNVTIEERMDFQPSGLPPHIQIMKELSKKREQLQEI